MNFQVGLMRARLKNAPKLNLQKENKEGLQQLWKYVQDIITSQPKVEPQTTSDAKSLHQSNEVKMSFAVRPQLFSYIATDFFFFFKERLLLL